MGTSSWLRASREMLEVVLSQMQALVTVILLYSLVGQQKSSLPIESIKKEGKEAS